MVVFFMFSWYTLEKINLLALVFFMDNLSRFTENNLQNTCLILYTVISDLSCFASSNTRNGNQENWLPSSSLPLPMQRKPTNVKHFGSSETCNVRLSSQSKDVQISSQSLSSNSRTNRSSFKWVAFSFTVKFVRLTVERKRSGKAFFPWCEYPVLHKVTCHFL